MTADDNFPADDQKMDASASAEQKPPSDQASAPPQPEIRRSPIIPPLPVESKVAAMDNAPVRVHSRRLIPPPTPGGAPSAPVNVSTETSSVSMEPANISAEQSKVSTERGDVSTGPSNLSTESLNAPVAQIDVPPEPMTVPVEPTNVPTEPTNDSSEPMSVSAEQTGVTSDALADLPEEKPIPEKLALQNSCRHEYVRIYQRRLKGLDRRLVATRAYLPVGFKLGDFGHLSEGSYCFCTKCRKRLFPKRSQGEKDQARLERQQAKIAGVAAAFAATSLMGDEDDDSILAGNDELGMEDEEAAPVEERVDEDKMTVEVTVDELEVESVDVEDIKAEGVKLVAEDGFEESCELIEDVDS